MAATFRLEHPVTVVASGRSGDLIARATARELHGQGVEAAVVDAETRAGLPARWPVHGVVVLCCGGPRPELERVLHDNAARGGALGLPVVLEHPLLRVGPVAVPGGPCSPCLHRRRRQLAKDGALEDLWTVFRGPDRDPEGVLAHELSLAAALAADDVARLRTGAPAPGRVRWFDVQGLRVASDDVVGVHGCPRCGGQAGPPAERTWAALSRHVAGVLAAGTGAATGATAPGDASVPGSANTERQVEA